MSKGAWKERGASEKAGDVGAALDPLWLLSEGEWGALGLIVRGGEKMGGLRAECKAIRSSSHDG